MKSGSCIKYSLENIQFCEEYLEGTSCIKCTQGYYLKSPLACKPVETISNCSEYNGRSNVVECTKCDSDFYLNQGGCALRNPSASIVNCREY